MAPYKTPQVISTRERLAEAFRSAGAPVVRVNARIASGRGSGLRARTSEDALGAGLTPGASNGRFAD